MFTCKYSIYGFLSWFIIFFIDEFVVISNHKFAQHFEDWKSNKQKTRPYEITVIDDGTSTNETRLGAVKDIQLAVEKLNLADDLLVMAGDNVLDAMQIENGRVLTEM